MLLDNDYLFPNYCDGNQVKSNSASSALNKWLKANVSKDIVVHSLRHAMRDRLRAVECPANIIDQIGGWSRKGVGESYGLGIRWSSCIVGWLIAACLVEVSVTASDKRIPFGGLLHQTTVDIV